MTKALFATCVLLLGSVTASAQDESERMWKLAQDGQVEEAVGLAEEYIAAHPDDPAGHHNLGRFFFMLGEHELAVTALLECLEHEPRAGWMTAWTHCVLGQCYVKLDQPALAEEHLRRALDLDATANCTRVASAALLALTGEDSWGKGPLHGKPLPDFAFHGLAGETYGRGDFAGGGVLFRFGATW